MRHLMRLGLAVILAVVVSSSAQASPITLIEANATGSLDVCSFCGMIMNPLNLSLAGFEFDNVAAPHAGLLLVFGGSFGAGSVNGGDTTYAITPTGPPAAKQLFSVDGEAARFLLTFVSAVVNNADPDTVVFSGTETLGLDLASDAYDFSAFSAGGTFTITVTAAGANFNNLLTSGGSITGLTGTISQTAETSAAPVPEPGTLLLVATATPVVIRAVRRRRRRNSPHAE
jgi:hypothetical protein